MSFSHIRVTPMTPTIGAMIEGVDLNDIASDEVYEEIVAALHAYQVVFFRDQPMTPEAHISLGRHFGKLEAHEFMPRVGGHPDIQLVAHEGYGASNTARWYTDVTYRDTPTMVSVLRAVVLPDGGGDTLWCSTAAAFDALPDPLKVMLLSLRAVHDLPFHRMLRRDPYLLDAEGLAMGSVEGWNIEDEIAMLRDNPPVIHPTVITHPVTGRLGLFVNSNWTKKFHDFDGDLGRHLLTMLWEWIRKPEFQVRFTWQQDSVAIWDNFATQHYAVFDYAPERRVMQRVIAGTAVPALDIESIPEHLRPPPIAAAAE